MRPLKILALVGAAIVVWLYLPPRGSSVSQPELAVLLDPDIPHGQSTFIDTGTHVYYRVRLKSLVSPFFGSEYFDTLRSRGVQIREVTTSPFAPNVQRIGWEMAFARETSKTPYMIEYWKSTDRKTWFPISLRWPWLYVRLGRDVLEQHVATLVPENDAVTVNPAVPRYPGAVLIEIAQEQELLDVRFVAPAPTATVLEYFAATFGAELRASISRSRGWTIFPRSLLTASI
jgi:hypothetical protein